MGEEGKFGDGLSPGVNLEFFVGAADVSANGWHADFEGVSDFFVGATLSHQFENLALAGRKRIARGRRRILLEKLKDLASDAAGNRRAALMNLADCGQ